jgi:uncharacterized tellurite resistance protein B-like protein
MDCDKDDDVSALAKLPALAILSVMYEIFSRNEGAISRKRELEADRVAADLVSPRALATALMKVYLYSELWAKTRTENLERLATGRIARNLSKLFASSARFDIDREAVPAVVQAISRERISHPTDSHPAIGTRLQALGVEPMSIDDETLLVASDGAIGLIDTAQSIEEELTLIEHRIQIAMGRTELPDGEDKEKAASEALVRACYLLAAAIINADGNVSSDEITAAERIGKTILEQFDVVEFREVVSHPEDIPNPVRVAAVLGEVLKPEGKQLVYDYLEAIANADQNVEGRESSKFLRPSPGRGSSRAVGRGVMKDRLSRSGLAPKSAQHLPGDRDPGRGREPAQPAEDPGD